MRNSLINFKNKQFRNQLHTEKIATGLTYSKNFWSSKDLSYYRFSRHTGDGTCRLMVGCRRCTYPSIHYFHGAGTLKITVGCQTSTYIQAFIFFTALTLSRPQPLPDKHVSKHSYKTCLQVVDCLVPHCKRKARADACAFTSDPQPQTGRLLLAMSQRRVQACPSLPGFSTLSDEAVSCYIVVVVAQPFSDVTR